MTTIREQDIQTIYEAAIDGSPALPYSVIDRSLREFYRNCVIERLAWVAPEWVTPAILRRGKAMYENDRKHHGAPKEQQLEWRLASGTAKTAYCLWAKGMFDLGA